MYIPVWGDFIVEYISLLFFSLSKLMEYSFNINFRKFDSTLKVSGLNVSPKFFWSSSIESKQLPFKITRTWLRVISPYWTPNNNCSKYNQPSN